MITTILLTRPELRELSERDYDEFLFWLLTHGRNEYAALRDVDLSSITDPLHEPAVTALPATTLRPTFSRLMMQIWRHRPDLQENLDIGTEDGQSRFVWWFYAFGLSEMKLMHAVSKADLSLLNERFEAAPTNTFMPTTILMHAVWRQRSDVSSLFDIETAAGCNNFITWFYIRGTTELAIADLVSDEQLAMLLEPTAELPNLPRVLAMMWLSEEKVKKAFPDPFQPAFAKWAFRDAAAGFPILQKLAALQAGKNFSAPAVIVDPSRTFGVNLVGYARGEFGIGEDVRMAVAALEAAGIPFSIYNVEPGREVTQQDFSVDRHIATSMPHDVTLLCTTGIETARLAMVEGGKLFDARRVIGFWPWELSDWPKVWHHAYDLVDEVWASSWFTYNAFVRSSPKPVRHMPMAVKVDETACFGRREFNLPAEPFLFIFSFDALSSFQRKNPFAVIKAFKAAFPRGSEPVGLVVKAMRPSVEAGAWKELLDLAASDKRIVFIGSTLKKPQLLDLYRACNCYVSLHRSEGFGRGIADCMMLGKPVIATGFSGNLDFTTSSTAALVHYALQPAGAEDYPYADGDLWAQVDIDHAAWWMRRLVTDDGLSRRLGTNARRFMMDTFDAKVVGAEYAAYLTRNAQSAHT